LNEDQIEADRHLQLRAIPHDRQWAVERAGIAAGERVEAARQRRGLDRRLGRSTSKPF
jgi:hypothetical protein